MDTWALLKITHHLHVLDVARWHGHCLETVKKEDKENRRNKHAAGVKVAELKHHGFNFELSQLKWHKGLELVEIGRKHLITASDQIFNVLWTLI